MLLRWSVLLATVALAASSSQDAIAFAVLAEEAQLRHLRAASCSWFQFVREPHRLVLVTEKDVPPFEACALSGVRRLRVRSLVDLAHVARRLAEALFSSSPRLRAPRWVLLVQAYTVVRPRKLAFLVRSKPEEFGAYAGFVRNASLSPYLGYLPHAAHEFGVLLRASALRKIAEAPPEDHDFRATEFGAALLASYLWRAGDAPRWQNHRFFPADARTPLADWLTHGVTLGPLDPQDVVDVSVRIWGPAARGSTASFALAPVSPRDVAFAVLVRESAAADVVRDVVATWGRRSRVLFFVSDEVAPAAETSPPWDPALHELVPLALGRARPRTRSDRFYDDAKLRKAQAWDRWLRHKVARTLRRLAAAGSPRWVVLVDDDTYVNATALRRVLATYDAAQPVAIGRVFAHVTKGRLVGGGPGVVISRAALAAANRTDCFGADFPIISQTVPGGDGWLGQCFAHAGVRVVNDWRFKSFPPGAYSPEARRGFVSFHRSSLPEVHADFFADGPSATPATAPPPSERPEPPCHPVYHWSLPRAACAPHFTIIGAQKAGTTSLHYLLGQHPWVALPKRKELNFWGSPWTPADVDVTVRSFLFTYLKAFPLRFLDDGGPRRSTPAEDGARVYGESSPDYLVSSAHVVRNVLRFVPAMRLIVSLREPIDRAVSAYENKRHDSSLHRHLHFGDHRLDHDVGGYSPPTFARLALDVNHTLAACRDHARHYTMRPRRQPDDPCYVCPFVLHGSYARYLRRWLAAFPRIFLVDYDALATDPATVLRDVASFLELTPFAFDTDRAYNTRLNRGVNPPGKKSRVGGTLSAVNRSTLLLPGPVSRRGRSRTWADSLDARTRDVLASYYAWPNAKLGELLDKYSYRRPAWLVDAVSSRRRERGAASSSRSSTRR